jgi:ketosteroid isomerase-like protein
MPAPTGLALALLVIGSAAAQQRSAAMTPPERVLEIRSYNLKAGTRENFHELFVREALPLLRLWKVDVVAYGPSLHDSDTYFLMRAFTSPEDRERVEDVFYGSAEWRNGPRVAVLAAIESYTTIVIHVDDHTLGGLRTTMQTQATSSDLEVLVRLNKDYIESVKESDVGRFREILADDFLCTLPDGAIIDREQFLVNSATPYALGSLQAHDVNVRLMGDFAIVHARTFTLPDGTPGSGRYTDVWARRKGQWLAVAAHSPDGEGPRSLTEILW